MRRSFIDMTGQVVGRLTVIEDSGIRRNGEILWRCRCECGAEVLVQGSHLRSGTKSCGCLRRDRSIEFCKQLWGLYREQKKKLL